MNSPKSLFICRYISMISSIQTFVSRKMSLDKLISIPCAEWPLLRDLFRHGWPENEVPFNAVQNYIDWIGIDPNIRHLQVLGLGDSWRGNGTFIVLVGIRGSRSIQKLFLEFLIVRIATSCISTHWIHLTNPWNMP